MSDGLDALLKHGRVAAAVRACAGARSGAASRWALALLLLSTLALLVYLLVKTAEVRSRMQQMEDAASELAERHRMRKPAPGRVSALSERQARVADTVVDRLNVPWRQVLDDVERYTPSSVAILQLEPEAGSSSLSLLVEAKSAEDVFRYLEAMQSARSLSRLRVIKYETNLQDAAHPVRFLLKGQLVSGGGTTGAQVGAAALPSTAEVRQ
jgi:Tfp pilus assembly protein PilN